MTLQENYEMHEQIGKVKTTEAVKQRMLAEGLPPAQIAKLLDIPESDVLKAESTNEGK